MGDIVIFLNGARGVEVAKAVAGSAHKLVALVISPGSGDAASALVAGLGLPYLELADVNAPEAFDRLRALDPELFIIAGYSAIFRAPLLSVPRSGTLNLHAGRLPQYRGGSPLNWQLLNGEVEAGISVIRADEGIDTGPVLAEATFPIGPDDTIANLHERANMLFPDLVLEALTRIEDGESGRRQEESAAQYWHQRNDADGRLDFRSMSTGEVDRMIRALAPPYPGAWSMCEGQRVRILGARLPEIVVRGAPGRICHIQGRGPYVVCSDRAILLTDYLVEGAEKLRLRHGSYLN